MQTPQYSDSLRYFTQAGQKLPCNYLQPESNQNTTNTVNCRKVLSTEGSTAMWNYWKLFIGIGLAAVMVWGLRTAGAPKPLYPISPKPEPPNSQSTVVGGYTIGGVVKWQGDKPVVPPMRRPMSAYYPSPDSMTPNPLTPQISETGGVSDVFLLLEGKGTELVPWNRSSIRIEWENYDCKLLGSRVSNRFAIAMAGDELDCISKSNQMHSVQARGADFFTLPLAVVDQPVKRELRQPGLVNICSGSWYYWAQARILVSTHGAVALTDRQGKFELKHVPEGVYELKAIKPNWNVTKLQGDPEFPVPVRAKFAPNVVLRKTIRVNSETPAITFELSDSLFKMSDK